MPDDCMPGMLKCTVEFGPTAKQPVIFVSAQSQYLDMFTPETSTPQESIKYFGVLWNECRVWNMTVIRRETEPPAQAVPCRYGRSGGVDDGGTERPTTPTLRDGRIGRTDRGKMAGSAEPAISTQ